MKQSWKIVALSFTVVCFSFVGKKEGKRKIKPLFKDSSFIAVPELNRHAGVFYAFKTELSNLDYKEYLWHLKNKDSEAYKRALPDSTAWCTSYSFGEPLVEHYFQHPAYNNYPLVNITKAQAENYCTWLGDFLTKNDKDGKEYTCRLPSKQEWRALASGLQKDNIYPWVGADLRNEKGQRRANYKIVGDEMVTYDHKTKTYAVVSNEELQKSSSAHAPETFTLTTPVDQYSANAIGMHNCAGNVAEMVANENIALGGHWASGGYDIRINSTIPFQKANPYVGFRPILLVQE